MNDHIIDLNAQIAANKHKDDLIFDHNSTIPQVHRNFNVTRSHYSFHYSLCCKALGYCRETADPGMLEADHYQDTKRNSSA